LPDHEPQAFLDDLKRRISDPARGLVPGCHPPGELARFYGIDERLSLDNLRLGTEITYRVLEWMTQ
jgi:hypothetical protein